MSLLLPKQVTRRQLPGFYFVKEQPGLQECSRYVDQGVLISSICEINESTKALSFNGFKLEMDAVATEKILTVVGITFPWNASTKFA